MPRDFISRDRKLENKKNFKSDNRKSVRNIERILEQKARDAKEKNSRINEENGNAYKNLT